jgi:hypothetical protein
MKIMGANINDAITKRTVANTAGDNVDKTKRAATNEKPHMTATRIAATVPYREFCTTHHRRQTIGDAKNNEWLPSYLLFGMRRKAS